MRFSFLLFISTLLGCPSADKSADTSAVAADTAGGDTDDANWWEVDDTGGGDLQDTGKTDDGKPDDGDGKESEDGWSGYIFTESWTGAVDFLYSGADGSVACEMTFTLTDITEAEDCSECDFAVSAVFGDVEVTTDTGACDELLALEGVSRGFGHGLSVLAEYEGVTYYDLRINEDGESWADGDGYSAVVDSEAGEVWVFGSKGK